MEVSNDLSDFKRALGWEYIYGLVGRKKNGKDWNLVAYVWMDQYSMDGIESWSFMDKDIDMIWTWPSHQQDITMNVYPENTTLTIHQPKVSDTYHNNIQRLTERIDIGKIV